MSFISILVISICACFTNARVIDDDHPGTELMTGIGTYENGFREAMSQKIPAYVDWRENDAVSPVKNQNNCSACWAFAIIGNIESQMLIRIRNNNNTLSEQFLIDCLKVSNGCGTTSMLKAFAAIVSEVGGVLREKDYYPYADEKLTCRWKGNGDVLVPVRGFRRIEPFENLMSNYIFLHGPLSAGINSKSMETYKNGIDEPTDETCSPNDLNHAVLIVGYSTYVSPKTGKSTPYWIIKNSWGTEWGDHGYYYLVRGRNACGIANDIYMAYL